MNLFRSTVQWRIPQLIFCHLAILLLLFTFFWAPTSAYWEMLDVGFFKLINGTLEGNPTLQLFWAFANHRLADWVEDLFILGFFTALIYSLPKGERIRGIAKLLFCILYVAAILFFVNRMIFREHTPLYRNSPSLVIENCVYLPDEISWMKTKCDSVKCFPSDHATTALFFAGIYTVLARRKGGIIGCFYAAFLCMPRMIVGAHWISDVLVGSGSIVLFFLGWAFCTPLHLYCTERIESFLKLFTRLKTYIPK